MIKRLLFIFTVGSLLSAFAIQPCSANGGRLKFGSVQLASDTVPPSGVMAVIKLVVYSTDHFNIETVADLYTPNAVVADDEPPYSWNGPTAGVQWVNAVERECKEVHLTKLKARLEAVNVYQQTADDLYIVVSVSYTGNLPANASFTAKGAFTFVLRMINGKWLIKSQAWMPQKGM